MRLLAFVLLGSLILGARDLVPGTSGGGVAQGVVYTDLNGNGSIEAGDGPLQGVDVDPRRTNGCRPTGRDRDAN